MAAQHPELGENSGLRSGENTRQRRGAASLLPTSALLRKGHASTPRAASVRSCSFVGAWLLALELPVEVMLVSEPAQAC